MSSTICTRRSSNRPGSHDFSDIDPAAVRVALAENGIVDGHVADPEKLASSPFIQQVIRDCVRTLIEYQTDDWPAEDIQTEQKKLNALYDAFVDKYGRITSRANNTAFSMDSSYFLLSSLEVLDDERNFVRKADT